MRGVQTKDFQDEAPINWDYKSPNRQAAAVGQNQTQYAKGFNVTDSMSLRSLNGESPEVFLKAQQVGRNNPAPFTDFQTPQRNQPLKATGLGITNQKAF